jgi:hypothetical protein
VIHDARSLATCSCWIFRKAGEDVEEEEEESEEEEEEEEESEESEDEAGGTSTQPGQELSRAERKALKKQGKTAAGTGEDAEDEDLINPNHVAAKSKKLSDLGGSAPRQLSRREREEKEKKEAKERYWKVRTRFQMIYCPE